MYYYRKKIFIHSNVFPAIHLKFPEITITISIKNSIFSNHTSVTTNYRTKLIRAFCFCDSITQYIVASCCRVPNFKVHCVFIVGCINGHEFYFINLWESNSNPTIFTITYIKNCRSKTIGCVADRMRSTAKIWVAKVMWSLSSAVRQMR